MISSAGLCVALRKESVDRNILGFGFCIFQCVALRKESVDRNATPVRSQYSHRRSLSARRAWIEITSDVSESESLAEVALRKESVDRNFDVSLNYKEVLCRSPQGERG